MSEQLEGNRMFHLGDHGFVCFNFNLKNEEEEYSIDLLNTQISELYNLCQGKSHAFLIDCRDVLSIMDYNSSVFLTNNK